jgi:hypothetical protein
MVLLSTWLVAWAVVLGSRPFHGDDATRTNEVQLIDGPLADLGLVSVTILIGFFSPWLLWMALCLVEVPSCGSRCSPSEGLDRRYLALGALGGLAVSVWDVELVHERVESLFVLVADQFLHGSLVQNHEELVVHQVVRERVLRQVEYGMDSILDTWGCRRSGVVMDLTRRLSHRATLAGLTRVSVVDTTLMGRGHG